MAKQTLRDLMTSEPTCCTPEDAVNVVARQMLEEDCGAIPVVESLGSRRVVGMITDRDITIRVVAKSLDPNTTLVKDAMSTEVTTLSPDASLQECMRTMAREQVRRMPLVEKGMLVGIVAQADLARATADTHKLDDELADTMEEISEPTTGARS